MSSRKGVEGSMTLTFLGIALVGVIAIAAALLSNNLFNGTDGSNSDGGVTVSKVQCTLDHYEELGDFVIAGVPYELGIRIQSAGDHDGVRICLGVTGNGIVADDVAVKYYDGAEWVSISLVQGDTDMLSGWFGPSSSFDIPYGYDEVVPLCVTFNGAGHYSTSMYAQRT